MNMKKIVSIHDYNNKQYPHTVVFVAVKSAVFTFDDAAIYLHNAFDIPLKKTSKNRHMVSFGVYLRDRLIVDLVKKGFSLCDVTLL